MVIKLLEENRSKFSLSWVKQWFLRYGSESISNKREDNFSSRQLGLTPNEELLCFKVQHQNSENSVKDWETIFINISENVLYPDYIKNFLLKRQPCF